MLETRKVDNNRIR